MRELRSCQHDLFVADSNTCKVVFSIGVRNSVCANNAQPFMVDIIADVSAHNPDRVVEEINLSNDIDV